MYRNLLERRASVDVAEPAAGALPRSSDSPDFAVAAVRALSRMVPEASTSTPPGNGRISASPPPFSAQVSVETVETIRSISESKSALAPPPSGLFAFEPTVVLPPGASAAARGATSAFLFCLVVFTGV
jgi:hypothetical protein